MKVIAGITLFNPNIERLQDNFNGIINQVDEIICVDNGSDNINEVKAILMDKIKLIELEENKGIAYALNTMCKYGFENGFNWILTLDQDSVVYPNIINNYLKYILLDRCGMLTCNIVDRNFNNTADTFIDSEGLDYEKIDICITSGAFMPLDIYKEVGGFEDVLFIDSVDYEYCYKLKSSNYFVYRINFCGVLHEVGNGKNHSFFLSKVIILNEPVWRHYYMARNHRYIVEKYPQYHSKVTEIFKEIKKELFIIFYESKKIEKIVQRHRGLKDAKNMGIRRVVTETNA
ncbi:hypothetical protein AXY43_20170 [Clostridium sp. MF28]|uniref:glycosyltransferase family 2 protein n=1 Tax=Clostridium TaxID=1485 RepID=UPI000CFA5C4C|nr:MULTISPECIES: glycosyltransferase family 2 protein [Clostridium]AVK50118.1 hypothetical protein AXY43_20170 [Clostridium sp. MF28]PSM57646.1 glycosyltransferase family 2 protein [Clostridium diolis]